MIIRLARKEDLPQLLILYGHLSSSDILPGPVLGERILSEILSLNCINLIVMSFGGDYQKEIVACCTLVIVPNLSRNGRPYGLIENVVTHIDFRCRGFGREILAEALQMAWGSNCYKVMLMTGSKKPETISFYEKVGFFAGEKTAFVARPPSHPSQVSQGEKNELREK